MKMKSLGYFWLCLDFSSHGFFFSFIPHLSSQACLALLCFPPDRFVQVFKNGSDPGAWITGCLMFLCVHLYAKISNAQRNPDLRDMSFTILDA